MRTPKYQMFTLAAWLVGSVRNMYGIVISWRTLLMKESSMYGHVDSEIYIYIYNNTSKESCMYGRKGYFRLRFKKTYDALSVQFQTN